MNIISFTRCKSTKSAPQAQLPASLFLRNNNGYSRAVAHLSHNPPIALGTVLFLCSYPRPLMPDVFQRSLLVPAEPPSAEKNLQPEGGQANEQADGVSAVRSQIQAEGEIDQCPDDGLRDIVREAHPAVKPQMAHLLSERPVLIQNDEGGHQHQGKRKLLPHVKSGSGRLLHNGVILHDEVFQRIERCKRYGRCNQCLHPYTEILLRRGEKLLPANVEPEQEQSGCLEEASGIDGPEQARLLPQRDVPPQEVAEVSGLGVCCHFGVHLPYFQVGQLVSRIHQAHDIVVPFDGLQQEDDSRHQNCLVTPVAGQEKDKAHHSEEQQHIAGGEKGGIQCGETHQKHHAPEEAIAEVLPLFLLVAALDVEGEAEQQGKDGVCLAGKKTENAVEHSLVQHIEPPRGTVGIYRKNEVFQIGSTDIVRG